MRKLASNLGVVVLVLAFAAGASTTEPVDPNTAALQAAVDAYAAAGLHASCATYRTVNIGTGSTPIVNNACIVEGSNVWHDAGLTAQMNGQQLQAELVTERAGGTVASALPPIFGDGANPDTVQVAQAVSRPSLVPASSLAGANIPVNTGGGSVGQTASTIGTIASAILPSLLGFFGVGQATEVTQIANNVQLAAQQAQQLKMYADMLRHSKNSGAVLMSNLPGELAALQWVMRSGLAYANPEAAGQLATVYPGYRLPPVGEHYSKYQQQVISAMDTLRAVEAHASAVHTANVASARIVNDLRMRAQGSEGRLQAAQLQAQIAAEEASIASRSQAVMLADANARITYEALHVQQQAVSQAAGERYFARVAQVDSGNAKLVVQ